MKESVETKKMENPGWLTEGFEQNLLLYPDNDVWKGYRQQQFAQFKRRGFPLRREEHWKYTDLAFLEKTAFHWPLPHQKTVVAKGELKALLTERARENLLLVFVNGQYAPQFSTLSDLPKGVIVDNVQSALQKQAALMSTYYLKEIDTQRHPFVSLNAAFSSDGLFLYLPRAVVLEKPLHVLSLAWGQQGFMMHPRHLIIMESDTQLCLTEEYCSEEADHYLTNAALDFFVGRNAVLRYNKVQNEAAHATHFAHLFFHQKQNSAVTACSFAMGSQFSRQELTITLQEPQAVCCTKGFYGLDQDKQLIDNHIYIDHAAPSTQSTIDYRGMIAKSSRAVFNGKVHVRPEAKKTQAQQWNHNLLLSPFAEIDTKPELEIYADEVECRHGATTGQIDEDSLFYLGTRGIDRQAATIMLLQAYIETVLSEITLPWLVHYLHQQWGRHLAKL